MAVTFGYEFFVVKPEVGEIVKGAIIPWCKDCDSRAWLQAVGIVGAVRSIFILNFKQNHLNIFTLLGHNATQSLSSLGISEIT